MSPRAHARRPRPHETTFARDALARDGNLLVAGDAGAVVGPSAFLTKLAPIPEPTSLMLLAGGSLILWMRRGAAG